MRIEGSDSIVVGERSELRADKVPLGPVLVVVHVAPEVVLLQLLEAFRQASALSSPVRGRGRLKAPSELALGGVDDGLREGGLGNQREDLGLQRIRRCAARSAAELRASVV